MKVESFDDAVSYDGSIRTYCYSNCRRNKREKYDYLIYDNHFPVGRIIANVLQLPSVSSCTTFAFNQYITFNDEHESREVDEMNPLYQSCLA